MDVDTLGASRTYGGCRSEPNSFGSKGRFCGVPIGIKAATAVISGMEHSRKLRTSQKTYLPEMRI